MAKKTIRNVVVQDGNSQIATTKEIVTLDYLNDVLRDLGYNVQHNSIKITRDSC